MKALVHVCWMLIAVGLFFFGRGTFRTTVGQGRGVAATVGHQADRTGSDRPGQTGDDEAADLMGAWERIRRERDPRVREEAMLAFMLSLAPDRCRDVVTGLLQEPRSRERDELMHLAYERWAEADGVSASASAQGLSGEEREAAMSAVIRGWAATDLRAAWRWIDGLRNGSGFNPILVGPAFGYYEMALTAVIERGEGARAAALIGELPEDEWRLQLSGHLTRSWSVRDLAEAQAWVDSLPEGTLKKTVLTQMSDALTLRDPQTAIRWMESLDLEARSTAATSIAQSWIRLDDGVGVTEWLTRLPRDPVYDGAFAQLAQHVAGSNTNLAYELIVTRLVGEKRDQTLAEGLSRMVLSQSSEALHWAYAIGDATLRSDMISRVYDRWSRRDADAARAYVENSAEISPELKQRLLQSP